MANPSAAKASQHKRHRNKLRDSIAGVTKPAIRRLARRGGVKRISTDIYDTTRLVLRKRLSEILERLCIMMDLAGRKTLLTRDVVFVLHRMGHTIYGFDDKVFRGNTSAV